MNKLLRLLVISSLLVLPAVAGAAAATGAPGSWPAAVDELLARDMIQLAQEKLKAAGMHPGHVDGMFDEETRMALLQYQRTYGLPQTGLLDEATRRELLPGLDSEE